MAVRKRRPRPARAALVAARESTPPVPLTWMRPDAEAQEKLPLRELPSGPDDAEQMGFSPLIHLRR
jgi:hypothetical protein